MSGTIKKRGNSWRIFVSGGTDASGKRVRHTETIHGTYQVARKRLATLEDRVRSGKYIANGFQTFDHEEFEWNESLEWLFGVKIFKAEMQRQKDEAVEEEETEAALQEAHAVGAGRLGAGAPQRRFRRRSGG